MRLPMKNINFTMCEDCGDTYYFSAEMLEKGFYIKIEYREGEKDSHLYDELIEIIHCTTDITGKIVLVKTYILRWDKPLSHIETYRLLKDLIELFCLYTVDSNEPFFRILDEMVIHYMETTEEHEFEFLEQYYHDMDLILKSLAFEK